MMFFFENLSKRLVAFTTRADLEREGQGHPRACSALFLRTEWAMVDERGGCYCCVLTPRARACLVLS